MKFQICVQESGKKGTVTFSFDDWAKAAEFLYICMCQKMTVDLIATDGDE